MRSIIASFFPFRPLKNSQLLSVRSFRGFGCGMNMKSLGLMSYETCSSAWTSTHINVPSRSYLCGALKQRPTTEVCASRGNSGGLGVLLVEVKAFSQSQPVAAAGGSLGVVSPHLVFRGSSFFADESSGFLNSGAYVWSCGKSCFLSLGRDGKRSRTIAAGKLV